MVLTIVTMVGIASLVDEWAFRFVYYESFNARLLLFASRHTKILRWINANWFGLAHATDALDRIPLDYNFPGGDTKIVDKVPPPKARFWLDLFFWTSTEVERDRDALHTPEELTAKLLGTVTAIRRALVTGMVSF